MNSAVSTTLAFQREGRTDAPVSLALRVNGVLTGNIGKTTTAFKVGNGFLSIVAIVEDDFAQPDFLCAAVAVGNFLISLPYLGVGNRIVVQDMGNQCLGGYVAFKGFPIFAKGRFAVFSAVACVGTSLLNNLFEFWCFV